MKTALLDGDGSLFTVLQPPGTAWQVNRDVISGFVRQPTGPLTGTERDTLRFLEARYALTGDRVAVVDVVTDGVPRGGTVSVPTARRCG